MGSGREPVRIRILWLTVLALPALLLAPSFVALRAEQGRVAVPVLFPPVGPYLPPSRVNRVSEPPEVLPDADAIRRYAGCYRFELPEGFHLSSRLADGTLEAYLARHPAKDSATSLRAHLHPSPFVKSSWTARGGVAAFYWSTGFSGLDVRLDRQGPQPVASAERFSDAIDMNRPPTRTPLLVREVPCSSLKIRKLEIWADMRNLEARRESRSRFGSRRGASLAAELARLEEKFGVTALTLADIRDEGEDGTWDKSPFCSPNAPAKVDLLYLEPEPLSRQPPPARGRCKRGSVTVQGIVTATGRFTELRTNGAGSTGYDPEAEAGAIRVLEDTQWLPALVCGRPIDVRHHEQVTIYGPCSAIESELGEVFKPGGEVSTPKLLSRVELDADVLRRRALTGQRHVWLNLTISKKGEVARVVLGGASPHETDREITAAVMQWKFAPARRSGKPVSVSASWLLPLPHP